MKMTLKKPSKKSKKPVYMVQLPPVSSSRVVMTVTPVGKTPKALRKARDSSTVACVIAFPGLTFLNQLVEHGRRRQPYANATITPLGGGFLSLRAYQ